MDFYRINQRPAKNKVTEIYPDFRVGRSKDLMVLAKNFYAIWDEAQGLWSTDEYDLQRLVDADLADYKEKLEDEIESEVRALYLGNFHSGSWKTYRSYIGLLADSAKPLDMEITFANTPVKKEDYVSKRLPYPCEPGSVSAYDELISHLYEPSERTKLEWAIGSVVSGDSKRIQKFVVLYGSAGAGKSTVLNIIQLLFHGYFTTFEARSLVGSSNAFATESFRGNPLVAIQHDGDLSRIEDNSKLNSIISHEDMVINEKFKPSYTARINAFLFMGTNKPVKITDAKSGIIRRLIDVAPSGRRFPPDKYYSLVEQIPFELGAIAHHCLSVYRSLGKSYYDSYIPIEMILQTDVFYNFIETVFDLFKSQDGASLSQAYELYKNYCDDSAVEFKLPRYKFAAELKNYFRNFEGRATVNGDRVRNWYSGFNTTRFETLAPEKPAPRLVLDSTVSLLDAMLEDCPAQYANTNDTPTMKWAEVETTLAGLGTTKTHYVKLPPNHIVIDSELNDENGNKSGGINLAAASRFPPTYAERSKGGSGIHLHYIYGGPVDELSRVYSDGIEVKVFSGDASLRRRLSNCNNLPVATISSGLPLKEKKNVIDVNQIKSEIGLRELIGRNLRKEIHPATKPSMDFIKKILDDAYSSDLVYDVGDLRPKIVAFAYSSTNQSAACVKLISELKFKSEEGAEHPDPERDSGGRTFFDIEVFPNLLLISYKMEGPGNKVNRLVNPSPQAVESLLGMKLVGFYNRRYDNHILYAAMMGYNNAQLYELSQKLVGNAIYAGFGEAYGLSYADIWDYSSEKKSLKKWEIELGIHHMELGLPWDQPVPDDKLELVGEYCDNDVIATEAVAHAIEADFAARQILAELSGLSVNDPTPKHTARILFGKDRNPQEKFVYTDLSKEFPGYTYDYGTSTYRGEVVGEGGLVRGRLGMYRNVALLDIASMHPTSLEVLNLFGPYTKKFSELKDARLAIKRRDLEAAGKLLGGTLRPYLGDEKQLEALSHALKIVINIVYGLTSAKFDNPFRDLRNKDNIVAKRGALFMVDLAAEIEKRGFVVAHIKTDSVKIPDATPEIIEFVMDFGKKYGYTFEHEATYEKMCLVNDAVYIAKYSMKKGKECHDWTATGTQFQKPYVFKTLFSHEPIVFADKCETKSVRTALYLDMNEDNPDERRLQFVGKVGLFCPIKPGKGGGELLREKDGEYHSANGAKGSRWLEAEMVEKFHKQDDIDESYYRRLVDEAVANISQYGDFEQFAS